MKNPLSLSFDNTEYAFAYKSDKALKKAHRLFSIMHYDALIKIGSALAPLALKLHLPIKGVIRNTIFKQFCGGETLEEVAKTAAELKRFSVGAILDYGVEASEGEDNYDQIVLEFKNAIRYAASQPAIPFISLKVTGFGRFELLAKYHSGSALTPTEEEEWKRVNNRVKAVCQTAYENKIGVLIDAEESWIQKPVDEITRKMMALFNKESVLVFHTLQMYLSDRLEAMKTEHQCSMENGYIYGAKLVRGAYLEKERNRAKEKGYSPPVQSDKDATDRDYNTAVEWCLSRVDTLAVLIGTHNEESCMLAAKFLHENNIPHDHRHVYFAQLYGMSDNITFNLAKAGYRTSKYLPYGPIPDVLPYLIRRSEENSSISGQMGRELRLLTTEINRRKNKTKA